MSDFKNELTLDDLLTEAEKAYPNLVVDGVVFLNPLQMKKEQRKAFREAIKGLQASQADEDTKVDELDEEFIPEVDEDDQEGVTATMNVLVAAAEDEQAATALIERIGDRTAAKLVLSKRYFGLSEVGEA